jgi:predicted cupin superfamily sugar epimerase
MTDDRARQLIETLDLAPHPEGGWFRETWRAAGPVGGRDAATSILFLLEQGQTSHWHRVDAAELWLFHAGSPITLRTAVDGDSDDVRMISLGADVLAGQSPQHLVALGEWQAADAKQGWALVGCVVVPGFSFDGFELAPPGWAPGLTAKR